MVCTWKKSFAYGNLLLVIVVLLSTTAFAQNYVVGVSPNKIDLGQIGPGEQKLASFFIVTPSKETLIVSLESERDNINLAVGRFGPLMSNYSEEDAYGWAQIIKNPVELKPLNDALATAAGIINGWREVDFVLNVPADAEPGYHSFFIKPAPATSTEQLGQVGAKLVAVTPILVYFNVSGTAIRSGDIIDITQNPSTGGTSLDVYFRNTGSTTVSTKGTVTVYDENDTFVASGTLSSNKIKPDETKALTAVLPDGKIIPSQYKVSANVSYITGMASKTMFLSLSAPTPVEKIQLVAPSAYVPTWMLIIAILIFIGVATYIIKRKG